MGKVLAFIYLFSYVSSFIGNVVKNLSKIYLEYQMADKIPKCC